MDANKISRKAAKISREWLAAGYGIWVRKERVYAPILSVYYLEPAVTGEIRMSNGRKANVVRLAPGCPRMEPAS